MFNRIVRTISATTAAVAMSLTAATTFTGVAGAGLTPPASPTPFQCAPGLYQVIGNQLKILNPVTGVYTAVGSPYSSNYNAVGYNVQDNFLYAIKPTGDASPKLLKVGSNGAVSDLGTPTGATLPSVNIFTAGDMDNSGHLIATLTSSTLLSIKVSDNTASLITLTKNGSPTNVYASDFSWINGKLYGVGNTTLYSIDVATGNVSTATVTGLTGEGQNFGATWSDSTDELFIGNNDTGHILKVSDKDGGSPSASKVANGTPAAGNDGASCKTATSPYVDPVASDDTYATTLNTTLNVTAAQGVLANDNGYGLSASKVSDPSHGTVTLNADGSLSYVPGEGYSGPDSFTYNDTDSSARTTNTATVNITVSSGVLYKVTYVANGGTGNVPTQGDLSESTSFNVGSGNQLAKAGYTFGGWSDGTSTYAAGASYTMGAADVVLTAQWTANATNTVTYDSQGGSSVSSQSGLQGTTVTVASAPTYAGRTFAGWNTLSDGTGTNYAAGDTYTLAGNATLFAQWTNNATNTLTYDSQGGSSVSSQSGLQGTTVTVASAPTYAGRTFAGWNTLSDGTGTNYAAGDTYTLAGNATLFAQWTVNATNTLTYDSQGGSSVSSQSGLQGTSLTLAAAPTYAGRTFAGWNTLSNGTGTNYAAGDTYTFAGDATLYAKWTTNTVITVTYNSQGGSSVSPQSGPQGTNITLAAAPSYPGHTFAGWNTLSNGTGTNYAAGSTYTLNGDVALYAKWINNATITVTYNSQGGSRVNAQSGLQGTTITLAAAPTYAGRTFAGWNTQSNGKGTNYAAGSNYTLNADVTLYAKWTSGDDDRKSKDRD
jgi:uncharacterized repeat protein (TIGR02543 family)